MTLVVYIDACDYLKQCTFKKRVITGSRNMCWLLLMRMLDRDDEPKSWQHHPTPPPPHSPLATRLQAWSSSMWMQLLLVIYLPLQWWQEIVMVKFSESRPNYTSCSLLCKLGHQLFYGPYKLLLQRIGCRLL